MRHPWISIASGLLVTVVACQENLRLVSPIITCDIDGGIVNAGTLEPGTLNRCCRPELNPKGWSDWFQPPVVYPWLIGPNSIVASDLLNRGVLDLGVAAGSVVGVLRNGVDSGFQLSSVNDARGILILAGDLNGDGYPDLVAAGSQGITALLATPGQERGFAPPVPYLGGQSVWSGVLADFNRDGALDLAVTVGDAGGPAALQIVWNQVGASSLGSGILSPDQVTIPIGDEPTGMAAGDLNGDGWPDLVVVSRNDAGVGQVIVLLNNQGSTDGSWLRIGPALPGGSSAWTVALDDFEGHGQMEVAIAQSQSAAIYRGHGDGTFDPPLILPAGPDPFALASADFDSDGVADLAVAAFSGTITVFRPSTKAAPIVLHSLQTAVSLAAGDFNLDGRVDLAVADNHNNSIQVFMSNCGGDGGN